MLRAVRFTTINPNVFAGCSGLTEIYFGHEIAAIETDSFKNHNDSLVFYGTAGTAAENYANENGIKFVER